jgi:hypothetical protein
MPQTAECFSQKITKYLRQLPYSHEGTMNEEWERCKGAITQAADEVLGKTILEPKKIWFDDDCQRVAAEKNTAYELRHQKCHTHNAVKSYQEKRKIEKKLHKKKK